MAQNESALSITDLNGSLKYILYLASPLRGIADERLSRKHRRAGCQ